MKKILVTRNLLPENEERVKKLFDAKLNKADNILSAEELINQSKDCDGILCIGGNKFDKAIIDQLSSSVKIIANYAVGYNNVDVDAAKQRGIVVTNTPEVLTDATADISILLLLGASRRAYEGRKHAETQSWNWSTNFLMGKQMSNKKLGILGMGRIGRAVAQRARGFGMEIHYHNRSKLSPDLELGATYHDNIKSLFSQSDFLSINCPATAETTNLLNEETINFLPDKAVVANAARGDIIDDAAMIKAMKSGKIFALGLDVYNGEPKINEEYLQLDNLFLLPHLGSSTKRTRIDMGDRAIDNLETFFSGKTPLDKVN
ncbi:MAG: 2-hydroxyacid dehydrogenase [Pelagibacteraceae bacterium]|jgi:lactate dehydrogenase-like 2-hydroxyacid dehydrogenase|nr:D-glycerate dehydrogenase [Pseudomonadota bacterium]NCW79350.1 D-glycerate dehydrogenase [Pelagibacteraceae bacterium]